MAERMTVEHLADVAALEALCFGEPWSFEALKLLLTDDAVGFVCVKDGHAVAYGGMLLAPGEGQVTNIAVHPKYRRQGLGGAIVEELIAEAARRGLEQIALEVRASNEAAIRLYRQAGFYEAGVRRRFYRNPTEDAMVMLLAIDEIQINIQNGKDTELWE